MAQWIAQGFFFGKARGRHLGLRKPPAFPGFLRYGLQPMRLSLRLCGQRSAQYPSPSVSARYRVQAIRAADCDSQTPKLGDLISVLYRSLGLILIFRAAMVCTATLT